MNRGYSDGYDDDELDPSDFDNIPYEDFELSDEIIEMCYDKIMFDFELDSDERIYFTHDDFGYIIFHITPEDDNPDEAYFTVWLNENYKKKGYKYTLEFCTKMANDDEEVDNGGLDDIQLMTIRQANNLQTVFSTINMVWSRYDVETKEILP